MGEGYDDRSAVIWDDLPRCWVTDGSNSLLVRCALKQWIEKQVSMGNRRGLLFGQPPMIGD